MVKILSASQHVQTVRLMPVHTRSILKNNFEKIALTSSTDCNAFERHSPVACPSQEAQKNVEREKAIDKPERGGVLCCERHIQAPDTYTILLQAPSRSWLRHTQQDVEHCHRYDAAE